MGSSVFVDVTVSDVEAVMRISCDNLVLLVHPNRGARGVMYTIGFLESQLVSLPIGEEFTSIFLIFTCVTILAPNIKLEGMHDLKDYIWDMDVLVPRNWGKFMFDYLEDGILEFKRSKGRYVRGCLLFLQVH